MDGAGDAVRDLEVHLGDVVVRDRGGLAQVTDGGLLDHVAHDEALDCLVLRGLLRAVAATHGGGVSTALLVTSVVASLDGHFEKKNCPLVYLEYMRCFFLENYHILLYNISFVYIDTREERVWSIQRVWRGGIGSGRKKK